MPIAVVLDLDAAAARLAGEVVSLAATLDVLSIMRFMAVEQIGGYALGRPTGRNQAR